MEYNEEIIPKVHLVPEAQPRDTNVPSVIIPISQFKFILLVLKEKPRDANIIFIIISNMQI